LVPEIEGKTTFKRHNRRYKENTKKEVKEQSAGLQCNGSEEEATVCSFEHGRTALGTTKGE
jgi:hypothetical protein